MSKSFQIVYNALMLRTVFFTIVGFALSIAHAGPVSITEINAVRQATGLPTLSASYELEQAASAHADYLERYMPLQPGVLVSAHEQRTGLPEFTGQMAPERAAYFGYPHSQVLENISLGNHSVKSSVADLMSAIYHRFAFLDFEVDEIGAANNGPRYVYNLGRRDLAQVCLQRPVEAGLSQPMNCLGKPMLQSAYQSLCAAIPEVAKFRQPYHNRCENGALLNAEFMQKTCKRPPNGAVLEGAGRYFDACGDGTRISAKWLDKMCQSSHQDVIYPYSGQVYQICEPAVEVHANWYQNYCENLPLTQLSTDSGRFYKTCHNGFKVKAEYYEELEAQRLLSRPEAVIWPADGASGIKPVFYQEDPHPTPDLPMTGYPISIQFNPQKVQKVAIMGFTLERLSATDPKWVSIEAVRSIDQLSDVQQKFSAHQFAWFPIQRLAWGTKYRYRIDALVNGGFEQYSAQFITRGFNMPVYISNAEVTEILAPENQFVLYRKPDAFDAFPFSDIELTGNVRAQIEAKVIDPNTVELHINGGRCSPVLLRTRLGEEITLQRCKNRGWRAIFD